MSGPEREPFSEDDLHAYVDGQLQPERLVAFERWLETNPEAASRAAEWRRQNEDLVGLFGKEAATPEEMTAALSTLQARRRTFGWRAVAASAVLFALGAAAGLFVGRTMPVETMRFAQTLPEASRDNYLIYASEIKHPVEVGRDQEAHLVQWLGNRIGRTLTAPDLSREGYQLVGGRLVPYAGKPSAMLMYENAKGERLTVTVGANPAHQGTNFRFDRKDGVSTFYWIDDDLGYALSAPIGREALLDLATEVHNQI